ncbi:hypothetical protein ACUNWD_02195 [Sunxiuqinia sp. A32]|uniref:hypothetical protein n=1 Tax=Sunxiuqinia sp. A32 TaxID=3461496 RepID=UPI0040465D62
MTKIDNLDFIHWTNTQNGIITIPDRLAERYMEHMQYENSDNAGDIQTLNRYEKRGRICYPFKCHCPWCNTDFMSDEEHVRDTVR